MIRPILLAVLLLTLGGCSAPAVIIQAIAGGAGLVIPQQQDAQP